MNIEKYINIIEKKITDPTSGLPEEVFLLISRISPMINVDLLIKNTENEVLLTWRHKGQVYPEGWHVPGGIIRYKEKILDRVHKVAKIELGCKITSENKPIVINEIMLNQKNRGHFISLLFTCSCTLKASFSISLSLFSALRLITAIFVWFSGDSVKT